MPAEIELKLTLDRAAAGRAADLARHPAVLAVRSGRLRTSRVVSTYYDTPDFALGKAGVALRLRRDGARWLQTVKGPPLKAQGGALHAHDEFEWRIGRPRLDLDRIETTPWHKVFRKARKHGALMPLFVTDVVRRALSLGVSRRHHRNAGHRRRGNPDAIAAEPAVPGLRNRDRNQVRQRGPPVRSRARAAR